MLTRVKRGYVVAFCYVDNFHLIYSYNYLIPLIIHDVLFVLVEHVSLFCIQRDEYNKMVVSDLRANCRDHFSLHFSLFDNLYVFDNFAKISNFDILAAWQKAAALNNSLCLKHHNNIT